MGNLGETLPYSGAPAQARPNFPSVPGYEVLAVLGRGGMGVVYKARHLALKRLVALKMILGEAKEPDRLRFKGEAEAVARLQHPNIVQVYEVGEWGGGSDAAPLPYCALEFIAGGSLDRLIQGKPQAPLDSARLLRTLALAVQAAHDKKIIHRDLKPANILLSAENAADQPLSLSTALPKITDFGLAKQLDAASGQTHDGAILGSPSYMAPEQADGRLEDVGPLADVYALGAILYELLTGRPPFLGQTVWATLQQVRTQQPVPPRQLQPGCPRDLETIALKALAKTPRRRYQSARELADDLQRYLDQRPILARPVGALERFRMWGKRAPMQAAAAAAVVVVVLLAFIVLLVLLDRESTRAELLKNRSERQQHELEEQQRRADVRTQFEQVYSQAETAAQAGNWPRTESLAEAGAKLLDAEPSLRDHAFKEPLARLGQKARQAITASRLRESERQKIPLLYRAHGDAVFFSVLFTGLELADNLARVRQAVRTGLDLFAVTLDGADAPAGNRGVFSEAEALTVAALCYELLWLDATALSQPHLGEKVETYHARLREALKALDRADRLGLGVRYAGTQRRADCLEGLGRKDEAEQLRKTADPAARDLAADYFLSGLELYRQQEYARAMPALTSALRKHKDHFGAEYVLALCQLREGHFQQAKQGLERCLSQRADFVWPRLLRGFAEMQLDNATAARADFDAVLSNAPDRMARYVAHVNRGALAVKQRDWDSARSDFSAAVAINPDAFAAHHNLALLLQQLAQHPPGGLGAPLQSAWRRSVWRTAVETLERAIARRDNVAVLYHERARLHLQLGDLAAARLDLGRAIALTPAATSPRLTADLLKLARLMLEGKEYRQTVAVLEAVLRLRPQQADAWSLKAEALHALKRVREAGEALDRYLDLAPEKIGPRTPEQAKQLSKSYWARGLIHVELNDFRSAAECYTRGLELARDLKLLSARGWAYLQLGAPGLARTDFEELLRAAPDDGDALLGRAEARVRLGDWEGALSDAERGLSRSAHTRRTLYTAARVQAQAHVRLAAMKQTRTAPPAVTQTRQRAVELLRQAVAQVPDAERAAFWHDFVERDPALTFLAAEARRGQP